MMIKQLAVSMILLGLSITSANALTSVASGNPMLVNYEQLVRALESGDDIIAIVHLDRCFIEDEALRTQLVQSLEGSSTRINFTRYLHYKNRINNQLKDTVVTSTTDFIEQTPGVFWTLFSRLSVFDDNTAILHIDYFDTTLHKSQLAVDWICDISNGKDTNGLVLFNNL